MISAAHGPGLRTGKRGISPGRLRPVDQPSAVVTNRLQ